MEVVVELGGRRYRIRELTYGEVLEYMEKSTKQVVSPTGELRQVVDVVGSGLNLIRLCVEVEDGGSFRRLTEQEIRSLPGRHGIRLATECMRVNDFLGQVSTPTQ